MRATGTNTKLSRSSQEISNASVPQAPQSKKGNTYTGSLRFRLLDTNGRMIELTYKGIHEKEPLWKTDPPDPKNKISLATLMQSR